MHELIQEIVKDPLATLLVIGNLVLIESLLSVDNAAVLATMVLELPKATRSKALKYGIVGAYIFRGICLLLASFLIKIWWLKCLGGLYLIYLLADWVRKKRKTPKRRAADKTLRKEDSWFYRTTVGRLGNFWATVIAVELMDIAFSLDNVFAAVAFSDNILIILCGVFIGILAMRFVAQGFVRLMELYPFLEGCAYMVIGVLGVRLILSACEHFYPQGRLTMLLQSHEADWATSAITLAIFILPVISCRLFNFPSRNK